MGREILAVAQCQALSDRLRIRIARRKNRASIGGRNVGVSFYDY